jgi:hypothetical protein
MGEGPADVADERLQYVIERHDTQLVIGGALILAVLLRLFQPAMLMLAHRREARFR